MRNIILSRGLSFLSLAVLALPLAAVGQDQDPDPAAKPLDEISRKASQLEGDLNKYKDNTPQAAATMLQLVDLYHASGRVFG
ncbi:MAG: hypothetical protein N2C14_26390, partial [Planctomycetales bacterium]